MKDDAEEELQDTDKLRDELQIEATRRYMAFSKLTLGLSFGALMFLLPFEKDYVNPQSRFPCLVDAAWILLSVSVLASLCLQFWFVVKPIWRWNNKQKFHLVLEGEHVTTDIVPWWVPKRETCLFWSHLIALVLAILSLAAYKIANLYAWHGLTTRCTEQNCL